MNSKDNTSGIRLQGIQPTQYFLSSLRLNERFKFTHSHEIWIYLGEKIVEGKVLHTFCKESDVDQQVKDAKVIRL